MAQPVGDAPTFLIRSFAPSDDLPAFVQLLQTVEASDQDGEDVREETVREQLALPGHDPARDRWVAFQLDAPASLLGWSFVWRAPSEPMATLSVAVHPAWRRRGIGEALLARATERARELEASMAGIYANARNKAATRFVLKHGFQLVSANTLLRIGGVAPLPEPAFPAGYVLRPYADIQDVTTLMRASNRCYAGLWGHHEISEAFAAEWVQRLRAKDIFVLFAPTGEVVGICRVERFGEAVAYIDAPGLVPERRDVNLYGQLVLAAYAHVRRGNPAAVELESWGDAEETLAHYQALGFALVRKTLAYERPLS